MNNTVCIVMLGLLTLGQTMPSVPSSQQRRDRASTGGDAVFDGRVSGRRD
jgi:hypothetical protein